MQGWALVPPEASINEYDDPAAIMVLTEGGQLMVHDLNTFQPVPLSLPFQELQAVTHCCMCASATQASLAGALQASGKLHSVTLERLRVNSSSPGCNFSADPDASCISRLEYKLCLLQQLSDQQLLNLSALLTRCDEQG